MAVFEIKKENILTVVLYAIVIGFLIMAVVVEMKDTRCTSVGSKQCGAGLGSAYVQGKPEKGDSIKTLLQKIRTTARYEVNSILWRRAFIAAVIASFLVTYVSKKRVPSGIQFVSAFLIIYIIFYLTLTMFQRWVSQPALTQLDDILDRLRKSHSSSSDSSSA